MPEYFDMQKRGFLLVLCFVCGVTVAQTTFSEITIQPKQTLYSIARDYNVPVAELKKLNDNYAPDFKLKIGDKFKIPTTGTVVEKPEKQAEKSGNTSGTHIVQRGETLYSISKKYNLTLKKLSDLNPKYAPDYQLRVGDKLKISENGSNDVVAPSATAVTTETPVNNEDTHLVQKSETLYFISKKYGISIRQLSEWNDLGDNPAIKIGQVLKVKESLPENAVTETVVYTPVSATATPVAEEVAVKEIAKESVPSDNIPVSEISKTIPVKKETAVVSASDTLKSVFTEKIAQNTGKTMLRGIANVVDNSELTSAAFVLYDDAEAGDIVKVLNLMSKKVIYLKVIGKTVNANEETILQVSPDTAKMLQANESRFLVEVTKHNP